MRQLTASWNGTFALLGDFPTPRSIGGPLESEMAPVASGLGEGNGSAEDRLVIAGVTYRHAPNDLELLGALWASVLRHGGSFPRVGPEAPGTGT